MRRLRNTSRAFSTSKTLGRVVLMAVTTVSLGVMVGCGSKSDDVKAVAPQASHPAPPPKVDSAVPTDTAAPAAPTAPAAPAPGVVTEAVRNPLADANRDDPKHIQYVLDLMNARLEDYYNVNQKFPKDIAEFKAWKHPNLRVGDLNPWPEPPSGKQWYLDPVGIVKVK